MTLKEYREYFRVSYNQFITQHNIQDSQISKNVRYKKLTDVDRIELGNNQWLYFKDGELKMIYISDEALAKKIWTEFKSIAASTTEETVRSRAGKTSNQIVFAEQGITVSTHKDSVDFIEIYPPQSLQNYLANIYRDPGPFIR
ncbi:hypothetical protein KK083_05690 [Fulvivirgaceae bacterium PWU4]|uniref:Uncharacterized protein n=1 Tax=Chryseosolibacter histidini TaxID=2782349 RepID=A0AAP2DJX5_9BACT|nr:hypothetical protein [Chryseosolibacter histidini]MBT1696357.1 hypothetical protein [Chryseosolibacter histidini]